MSCFNYCLLATSTTLSTGQNLLRIGSCVMKKIYVVTPNLEDKNVIAPPAPECNHLLGLQYVQ